jgi:protein-S-isoprenylcysteine O-methyltransferase Ste14
LSDPPSRLKEKKGEHPSGDSGQVILLGLFLVVWVADSFFLHESTFLSNFLPIYIRLLFFGLIFAAALFLFKSGHVVVSQEQRPTHVVADGAFRYVRHPLYFASILTYLALWISTLSLASLCVVLGVFIFYNYIASYEERLLETKFGDKYKMYERQTGKWLPRIHRRWP